jgi:hypothetical protein
MIRNRSADRFLQPLQRELEHHAKAFEPKPECCPYFMKGHAIYKGQYIPSREEYEAHGYKGDYEIFCATLRKEADLKDSMEGATKAATEGNA